jgi:carbamoyl-phosphate synthase / aspartate carbamoyltransferase / dihydroorotase
MALLRLPSLVDPHVHLREPGATHKEDFDSGTAAALAGGFSCVLDMPNNTPPVTDTATLAAKQQAAASHARCDYGLYLGAGAENVTTAASLAPEVAGLKLYLDQTFGPLRLDELETLVAHAERWPADRPFLCHAEERTMAAAMLVAQLADRPLHICHVSRQVEIELIRKAKERGLLVTCEVTPHHLFLSQADIPRIGTGRAEVRPRLATPADCAALRANLDVVDCFATDHAPHTLAEKDSPAAPPGFPGLETALPLYLALVETGVLTLDQLIEKTAYAPRRLFGLSEPPDSWVEVDLDEVWTVRGADLQTRARWSPFEGRRMRGRVVRVVVRGEDAYHQGQVLAQPGAGHNVNSSLGD